MTKLKPTVEIITSKYTIQDKKEAKEKLLTLSVLLDISIEFYIGDILKTAIKKKEVNYD